MAENNSITDIRYKLLLRMMGELELTDSLVAPDNPYDLEASVIAEFEAYRKAWVEIAFGSLEGIHIDYNSEMLLAGITMPVLPDGWFSFLFEESQRLEPFPNYRRQRVEPILGPIRLDVLILW